MCSSGDRKVTCLRNEGQVLQRWAGSLPPPVDSAFQHQPPGQSYSLLPWKAFSKWQWEIEQGQDKTRLTIAPVTPTKQPPAEGKGFSVRFGMSKCPGRTEIGQTLRVMDPTDQSLYEWRGATAVIGEAWVICSPLCPGSRIRRWQPLQYHKLRWGGGLPQRKRSGWDCYQKKGKRPCGRPKTTDAHYNYVPKIHLKVVVWNSNYISP